MVVVSINKNRWKLLLWWSPKGTDDQLSQSQLEWNKCGWHKARENECERGTLQWFWFYPWLDDTKRGKTRANEARGNGFGFTPDWMTQSAGKSVGTRHAALVLVILLIGWHKERENACERGTIIHTAMVLALLLDDKQSKIWCVEMKNYFTWKFLRQTSEPHFAV